MFIRSERLFLRPGWPEDWMDLLAVIDDESIIRNLARAPWPYTADDARDFLALPQQRLFPRLFITLPSADGTRLIGSVGLSSQAEGANLGYWIAREHWGNGYATEAVRAMLSQARAFGHRNIIAHHFADNPASGRVLRKVGFCPTGTQGVRYCLGRQGVGLTLDYSINLAMPGDCNDDMPAFSAA